jgi:hypothetical protein
VTPCTATSASARTSSPCADDVPCRLDPIDEGRNVNSFVRGDSRHTSRSIADQCGDSWRSSLPEHSIKRHSPGRWRKVAASARQPETGRSHSRQPALNDPLTVAVRPQDCVRSE